MIAQLNTMNGSQSSRVQIPLVAINLKIIWNYLSKFNILLADVTV
jgi:hypothetical protein